MHVRCMDQAGPRCPRSPPLTAATVNHTAHRQRTAALQGCTRPPAHASARRTERSPGHHGGPTYVMAALCPRAAQHACGCGAAQRSAWLGETCAARRVTVEEVLREVGVAAEDPRARRGRAVGPRCANLRVAQAGGGAGRGWAREGVGGQGGGCGGCVPSCRQTARTAYAPHTLRTHPRLLYP